MLPILYQNPEFVLYSYPLLMGIGWGVAYQIFFSHLDQLPRWKAQLLFWGIFVSAWVGAKLLFYATYKEVNRDFLGELSFWTGGGFVFYGGFLAATCFVLIFNKLNKISFSQLWFLLPALAIGHGTGRIGCFLAGCCFGKPTELFWGVFMHGHYRHPTQLIEAIGLFALGFYLLYSQKEKRSLFSSYLMGYGLLRLIVEALRGDSVRGSWGILTPSQWISLGLLVAGISLIFLKKPALKNP